MLYAGAMGRIGRLFGATGRKVNGITDHLMNLSALTFRLFTLLFRQPREGRVMIRKVVVEQVYFTAIQALPLIIPIALVMGSAFIAQFSKLAGQYDTGKLMVALVVRELGPLITALIVILRSATSVTIELGYMNVLHETHSIEMAGIDPFRYICVPRLIGISSAICSLFIIFDLCSILGGYAIVWTITYIPINDFFIQISRAITASDILVGIIKALCFGVIITVVSIHHGLNTRRRITDIPPATSRAAVESFFFCLATNAYISLLFYL